MKRWEIAYLMGCSAIFGGVIGVFLADRHHQKWDEDRQVTWWAGGMVRGLAAMGKYDKYQNQEAVIERDFEFYKLVRKYELQYEGRD